MALCGCEGAPPMTALAEAGLVSEVQVVVTCADATIGAPSAAPTAAAAAATDGAGASVGGFSDIMGGSWAESYAALGLSTSSPIALLLSLPLTLLHVLRGCGLLHSTTGRLELRVHCLGASAACEGRLYSAYALLARLLPAGTRLHVVMIGPQLKVPAEAVSDSEGGSTIQIYRHSPSDTEVHVSFVLGLYHAIEGLAVPDLAIAHNAGIVEYDSWRPTVGALLERRIPFVFSSYAMVEVDAALAELWEAHGVSASDVRTELNPFRMPLDEARKTARGAISVLWVPNAVLSFVTHDSGSEVETVVELVT